MSSSFNLQVTLKSVKFTGPLSKNCHSVYLRLAGDKKIPLPSGFHIPDLIDLSSTQG